ncbi:Brf1, TBP-binding domain [Sesbania bispinosa]|nr:Brf1, TBP-binding domain [Sesbania bispinosa]
MLFGDNNVEITQDNDYDELYGEDDTSAKTHDESDSFSDIDDQEIDGYLLHNEEEKHYKKIIWETLNREYLEEQAFKEADAATAKEVFEENFEYYSDNILAAREQSRKAKVEDKKDDELGSVDECENMDETYFPDQDDGYNYDDDDQLTITTDKLLKCSFCSNH